MQLFFGYKLFRQQHQVTKPNASNYSRMALLHQRDCGRQVQPVKLPTLPLQIVCNETSNMIMIIIITIAP